MSLDQLVPRLAPTFAAEFLKRSVRPCRIFLSASDMKSQAVVRNASDVDPTDAFNAALDQLRSALGSVDPIILRADWITDVESMTWEEFNKLIGSTARNNFNRGVAFSPDFSIALTALEINANQLLAVADNQNGAFNLKAASSYIRARFDRELPVLEPSSPIAVFDTAGAFVLGDNAPLSVDGTQHRIVTTPDAKLIRQIMQSAVQYLESQLLSSGRFIYGRLPCTDRFVPSYNAVNHFTALLALLDAYNADGRKDDHLRESIERAIKYGVETYSDLLSDETYAPLKTAFDGFLNARTVPNVNELLAIVGADDPKAATEARAKALLDEYFWTETAMFFKCPEMIFGSFFSRDDAFRVRIDDTARALASLVEWSKHAPAVEHVDDVEVKPQIDQAVQKMVELISANRSTSPRGEAKIFFGGNTIVGRRMHLLSPTMKHLDEIPAMRAADVRIVNLLGVASALGDPVNKKYFYHMHARPEQINILTECNIDVVLTANHHAGDYGAESVLDQNKLLDEAGLGHVGAGKNIDEASAPIYVKANDLTVAIFSVDATTEEFAASEAQAGIFYMSQDALDAWTSTFDAKIAEARKHADAVFVALDWEPVSQARSFDRMRAIGRALIDSGADGVLGCDSYWYNRVEKYKERPIIYGAGLFILDGGDGDTGAYSLTVGVDGVKALTFSALRRSNGKVGVAERDKNRINDEFLARCRELGTNAKVDSDGTIEIKFSPAARPQQSLKIDEPSSIYDPLMVERHEIKPLTEPLSEWTVERVPDDAIIEPKQFDALKMVGYRVEQPVLTKYEILFVDTYWTIDAPLNKECRFYIEGKSTRENGMPFYGSGADHEFANWEFPVKRWKPGVIYRERFGLNPPRLNRLANVDLRIEIRARIDGRWLEPFIGSKTIEMRLPELPYYRRDFPEVLEHSEPGHCWTAEQLAAVTGGKWLVEPPSGWYVQSILRDMKFYNQAEAPVMFVASRRSQYLFHTEGDPASSTYDNHFMVAQYADKIAGAMIDHEVDDLPKDLPVLLVEDSVKATIELGFAARRRFKGKTIAVAGDVGKTTTVNMLEHLLKESGEVAVPFGTDELTCISAPTTFANVKAEAAYAILELSKDAIEARRGSVTYDLQPNVVVVTSNAGLEKDSEAAARVKARVFCGAVAGGYAVLNRDMKHYGIFEAAAKRHGLNVITFGRHADATVRMPELKRGESVFIDGDKYKLESALSSEQLYNALAVLAVAFAVSQGGGAVSSIIERLKSFDPKRDQSVFMLETKSDRKIVIGLHRLWHSGYPAVAYTIYARAIGCDCYMFYPADVDLINRKINAHVYRDGKWVDEVREYPDVIDNGDKFLNSTLDKPMLVHTPHTGYLVANKKNISDWIEADPVLRKYMIPYFEIKNGRDAVERIDKSTAPLFFKPTHGSLGQGIMMVSRLSDGNYELTEDKSRKVLTLQELNELMKKTLTKPYIAQRYIKSCLSSGMPFDVRIHVRRDKTTQWHIVKIYARVSLANALTSNLATGGSMMDGKTLLRLHLGKDLGDRTYNRIVELGKIIPERLQRTFRGHNFNALGIDLGIEADGSIFLFEINDYPGSQYFMLEAASYAIDYAKTLAFNPDLAFPEV